MRTSTSASQMKTLKSWPDFFHFYLILRIYISIIFFIEAGPTFIHVTVTVIGMSVGLSVGSQTWSGVFFFFSRSVFRTLYSEMAKYWFLAQAAPTGPPARPHCTVVSVSPAVQAVRPFVQAGRVFPQPAAG